ncbi:MAG: 50S ribosomal protein L5 [Actinomycetota bacterium]|nr:50S ribosomal protein L5 [Actinomycetota bacterium]MDI6822366.1 50S ribosomal protein L5 [Actinomycetota bacterium]
MAKAKTKEKVKREKRETAEKISGEQIPKLKRKYKEEIVSVLMKEFNFSNPMQVPRLEKIIINMGVGEGAKDSKAIEAAAKDLVTITGQKPMITRAKKSIAGFKIRKGVPVGCKVTLRGNKMYDFLDRLLTTALPRIRDFRGLNRRSFDGRGNYTFGVDEQLIFPEVDYDKVTRIQGMDITLVTTTGDDELAYALLKHFGLPIREK